MEDFIKLNSKSLDWYIDQLKQNNKFSLSRWGDGEWICASGASGENCDGHKYFPEIQLIV